MRKKQRQIVIALPVVLVLVGAGSISPPQIVQAQPLAPNKLWHVTRDPRGNMVDDNNFPIKGTVKGLSCIRPNDCWAAVQ
jgi:hypothetical protein